MLRLQLELRVTVVENLCVCHAKVVAARCNEIPNTWFTPLKLLANRIMQDLSNVRVTTWKLAPLTLN